eukprot:scaffold3822_cov42-Attheya_sp.AAC.4
MEPAFQRGDILFLNNSVEQVGVGDVVVFKIKDREIPIVHRILKVHTKPDGVVELLTKGDNNRVDDRGLYAPGQLWLERQDILGKATGTLRYVGCVTIALNDYPVLRYVMIGMMGLFVLTSKEEKETTQQVCHIMEGHSICSGDSITYSDDVEQLQLEDIVSMIVRGWNEQTQ